MLGETLLKISFCQFNWLRFWQHFEDSGESSLNFSRFSLAKDFFCHINLINKSKQALPDLGIAGSDLCVIKLVQLSRRFLLPEYFSGVEFIDSKIFILCIFSSFTCGKNYPS